MVVFVLFFVIFALCMVAIYGGINPKGLVLRETFQIRETVRRTTTTSAPINVTENERDNASLTSSDTDLIQNMSSTSPMTSTGTSESTVSDTTSDHENHSSTEPNQVNGNLQFSESTSTTQTVVSSTSNLRHSKHRVIAGRPRPIFKI